jgi:carboxyl-terminal processing protease
MNQAVPLDRKFFLLSMILLALLVLIAGGMGVYVLSDPGIGQAHTFTQAALKIDEHHGYEVAESDLITSARRAMFDRLDRYSSYVESAQFERLDEELTGHYSGIGITVIRHEQGLLIMSVRENSPAGQTGLLTGDVIIAADSVELAGISADSATGLLRGEEGTSVLVRIFRPVAKDTVETKITRRRIPLLHIPFAGYTSDSLVYIRLLDFEAGATEDVKSALDSLIDRKCHSPKPRGLILDLRGNPGGLFAEAYETADLFLEEGAFIVGTDGRSRWNEREYYATGTDLTGGLPLAVIIDRGSASSAEIVAGALKQAGRAVLIGDTTFGKGLVQGFTRFPDGDGLRLTIARYYFNNDLYLNDFDSTLHDTGHGLVPDYYFSSDEAHPFVWALDYSLLLQQFASQHQDEIITATEGGELTDDWPRRFASFAKQNDFTYASTVTRLAELLADLAEMEQSSNDTKQITKRILDLARQNDQNQFHMHSDYIKMRLKQVAFERKFGTYRAYRDVIVPERPVIRFASRVLLESN